MKRRTHLRHALWAVPLALTLLGPTSQAVAQSEGRQNDLNQTLQNRERDRSNSRQQDRNAAQDQLQRQELQRQQQQQQQNLRQRQDMLRGSERLNERR